MKTIKEIFMQNAYQTRTKIDRTILYQLTEKDLNTFVSELVEKLGLDSDLNHIFKEVCKYFKLDEKLVKSGTRKRGVVKARWLFYLFARKYTFHSTTKIARKAGQSHCSVLYGIQQIEYRVENNWDNLKEDFDILDCFFKNFKDNAGCQNKDHILKIFKNHQCEIEYENFTRCLIFEENFEDIAIEINTSF